MRLIRRHLSTATHHKKSRRLIVDPGGSAVRSKTVRSCRFYSRPAAKPLRSRPPILRRKVASLTPWPKNAKWSRHSCSRKTGGVDAEHENCQPLVIDMVESTG